MIRRVRAAAAVAARRVAARAARGYIAGATLGEARRTADVLLDRGYRLTLAYWDGVGEEPDTIVAQHGLAIEDIAAGGGDYVSVKAPSFGFDRDATAALVAHARARSVAVHFDSLALDTVDPTLDLISSIPGGAQGIGITIPGRWRRSPADAVTLAAMGVVVRVVKGQWPDPGAPDLDSVDGFMAVVRAVAGTAGPVRVATHDGSLAKTALAMLGAEGTPAELEVLYGLPVRRALDVVAGTRYPVRVYLPYGHGWLPYALDGLDRSPRLMMRLVRDAFGGRYLGGFRNLLTES